MTEIPNWMYDETEQKGVDYLDAAKAQEYDAKTARLRNTMKECAEIITSVGLSKDSVLAEIGAGTGEFTIEAAKYCAKAFAIDISPTMLEHAKAKTNSKGINNVEFLQGGFLTYEHHGSPPDVIVSQFALHHLPDFWKFVALIRINRMLKQGGLFYLKDTVYSFDVANYKMVFDNIAKKAEIVAGKKFTEDIEKSIKNEYATLDWIMEGIIEKAGFQIEKREYQDGVIAKYLCRKP